ncbi:hypothetical protein NDU88_006679 [Pleurodeles waltl]|uniref:Uncharacterized protein n=1 Tax=Pleurodeles waltl TaxID=8319 RepID=A0AAV7LRH7_PLEWA|nr:hypothetical protein NDU88_006679 [Pleurodeles waltl]
MAEEGSASGASLPLPAALEALGRPRGEAAKGLLVGGSCGRHFLCCEGRDSALGPGQRGGCVVMGAARLGRAVSPHPGPVLPWAFPPPPLLIHRSSPPAGCGGDRRAAED